MPAKKAGSILPLLLCLGLFLALGVVFRSFFMDNLVRPIALVVWAAWRILASVDQQLYWGLVILTCLILGCRMIPADGPGIEDDLKTREPQTRIGYEAWLSTLTFTEKGSPALETMRQRLKRLLVSVVVQTERMTADEAEEMIRAGHLPISRKSLAFVFPERDSLGTRFHELRLRSALLLANLYKKRGPRMPAIILGPIDEILTLMEAHTEKDK